LLSDAGQSQRQLSEFLGISQQSITEWKAGRSVSYTKYIDKIAQYFGVSVDYLLGTEKSPSSLEDGLTEKQRKLVEMFKMLPEDKQKEVVEYTRWRLEAYKGEK